MTTTHGRYSICLLDLHWAPTIRDRNYLTYQPLFVYKFPTYMSEGSRNIVLEDERCCRWGRLNNGQARREMSPLSFETKRCLATSDALANCGNFER